MPVAFLVRLFFLYIFFFWFLDIPIETFCSLGCNILSLCFKNDSNTSCSTFVNISKCHENSSNHCISGNMHVDLYAAYSILILRHIGMGKVMIVSVWASHAFHSLRKSSQVDDVSSPYPNAADSVEIVIRQPPVSLEKYIENNLPRMFFYFVFAFDKKMQIDIDCDQIKFHLDYNEKATKKSERSLFWMFFLEK